MDGPVAGTVGIAMSGNLWTKIACLAERVTALESASPSAALVDATDIWVGGIDPGQAMHGLADGTPLDMTETRADGGWTVSPALPPHNDVAYLGAAPADYVTGTIAIQWLQSGAGSNFWARPEYIVENVTTGTRIAAASDLYMVDSATYSSQGTPSVSWIDPAPGVNPVYRITMENAENRTANMIAQPNSQITLTAVRKVSVFVP